MATDKFIKCKTCTYGDDKVRECVKRGCLTSASMITNSDTTFPMWKPTFAFEEGMRQGYAAAKLELSIKGE